MGSDKSGSDIHRHEMSSLLCSTDNNDKMREILLVSPGSASLSQTAITMCKTCAGTGCLALPYAAKQGGLLLYFFGTIGIAWWNALSSTTLIKCLEILLEEKVDQPRRIRNPPSGSSRLGSVAFYALGAKGLLLLDILTGTLLMGIIVAYQDAIRSFLQGTPFKSGSDVFDAIIIDLLIAPLSIVPDIGYLNRTSAAGLSVLAFAVLVIAGYGLLNFPEDISKSLQWFPLDGLTGASNFFGCTVFGFGVVPFTYNYQESMAKPKKLPWITFLSLSLLAITYIVLGIGLLLLYPNVENDILAELPEEGVLPIVTRLAMVIVVMATAPIIIVPCGELIEGKLAQGRADQKTKILVRFGICLVTAIISVGVPGFVNALSLVGCFSVAIVGFCVPPFLHLALLIQHRSPFGLVWVADVLLLLWGLIATSFSTTFTLRQIFHLEMK